MTLARIRRSLAPSSASAAVILGSLLMLACKPDGESGAPPADRPTPNASQDDAAPSVADAPAAGDAAAREDAGSEVALASTAAADLAAGDAADDADPAIADGPIADDAAPPPDGPLPPPAEPYKVLIVGDSFARTGFGALLEKKLDDHPHVVCYRKGKSASGLARPDYFDWIAEGKRQVDLREPDLVVVIMGGNDGQDLTGLKKSAKRVPWKHDGWPDAYRGRVESFLAQIDAPGRKILWLGLPTMGLSSLEKKVVLIRGVQQEAVEALGDHATYLDTTGLVTTDDGALLTHARVGGRKSKQALRADDKIHFTMAGSQYFADGVYPEVLGSLRLGDVDPDAEEAEEADKAVPTTAPADPPTPGQ